MDRDIAREKASSSFVRLESSTATTPLLLKSWQLHLEEQKRQSEEEARQEQKELERERFANETWALEVLREM
ncbi:hypothetical protein Tco_1208393 [Tanacetum coccineum]